jgi:hypothetical protein
MILLILWSVAGRNRTPFAHLKAVETSLNGCCESILMNLIRSCAAASAAFRSTLRIDSSS